MKQYQIVKENKNILNDTVNCATNLSNDIENQSNDLVIMDEVMLMRLYDNLKSVDTSRIVKDFRNKFNYHQHMSMEEYTKIVTEEYKWLTFKDKITELKMFIEIEKSECTDIQECKDDALPLAC